MPSVGDTVGERFEVRERVGEGGFATVWRARDVETDDPVALKCADGNTHPWAEVRSRFEREARTLGRFEGTVTPSSVVRYLAGDTDAETPYIALEFLPGAPLDERIRDGSLGTSVRRRVAIDLAATLDFLHRNGVVYLDLRPENVVVRRSGRPVLVDFNTAATTDESIETRFEADQFKAPELLGEPAAGEAAAYHGADPGLHSDVYAWGKLAFYLFTGAKVVPEDVPAGGLDPLSFGATCSRTLAEVVARATRPDPSERFSDGAAVAGAVARATGRERMLVSEASTEVACPVTDGETMGRLADDEAAPWLVVPDPGRHVSPQHARFEYTTDGWVVEDISLNGTYVGESSGWTYLLSDNGHATQAERGTTDAIEPPPTRRIVPTGAVLAPVHPEYGVELRLRPLSEPHEHG
jgi:serine/threonine protein kinase